MKTALFCWDTSKNLLTGSWASRPWQQGCCFQFSLIYTRNVTVNIFWNRITLALPGPNFWCPPCGVIRLETWPVRKMLCLDLMAWSHPWIRVRTFPEDKAYFYYWSPWSRERRKLWKQGVFFLGLECECEVRNSKWEDVSGLLEKSSLTGSWFRELGVGSGLQCNIYGTYSWSCASLISSLQNSLHYFL